MSQLDLVVTPDSSLAHLAGGLGVRVWVPLSTVGEWRWLIDRDDSPWYPTMRLFRQTTLGDWDERLSADGRHCARTRDLRSQADRAMKSTVSSRLNRRTARSDQFAAPPP